MNCGYNFSCYRCVTGAKINGFVGVAKKMEKYFMIARKGAKKKAANIRRLFNSLTPTLSKGEWGKG